MRYKINIIDIIGGNMSSFSPDKYDVSDAEILNMCKNIEDVDMPGCDNRTLLIYAASNNRLNLVKKFIKMGANINAQDMSGYTALHSAVTMKFNEITRFLVTNGANVNIVDSWGNPPLNRCNHLNFECFHILLEHGADCTIENKNGISPKKLFAAYPEITRLFEMYESKNKDE